MIHFTYLLQISWKTKHLYIYFSISCFLVYQGAKPYTLMCEQYKFTFHITTKASIYIHIYPDIMCICFPCNLTVLHLILQCCNYMLHTTAYISVFVIVTLCSTTTMGMWIDLHAQGAMWLPSFLVLLHLFNKFGYH